MNFLSDMDDEEILPTPVKAEKIKKSTAHPHTLPQRKRGRPRKDETHREQLPQSKLKIKENKDQISLQRKVNDEKERWQVTKI
jgi:hypothetical protein